MRESGASDDIGRRIGGTIRATRTVAGWSERELAARLGTSQSAIHRLEAGGQRFVDVRLASAALELLGIRMELDGSTLGLAGRREQHDLVHARCCGHVARRLGGDGWEVKQEVEVGSGRYRGWIDLLAYRVTDRCLFCVEIKTEIDDVGRIQRTLGWYEREAWDVARRFGWQPRKVCSALLILCSSENDARVSTNREVLAQAFPTRARELGDWALDGRQRDAGAGPRDDRSEDATSRMAAANDDRRPEESSAVRKLPGRCRVHAVTSRFDSSSDSNSTRARSTVSDMRHHHAS